MNPRVVLALIVKDFTLFFRNRFFAVVTPLGLVAYMVLYLVMPGSVDETLKIGIHAPGLTQAFEQIQQEGLEIAAFDSGEALKDAVTDGSVVAGVSVPPEVVQRLAVGEKSSVTVYFASDVPEEIRGSVQTLIGGLFLSQLGQTPAVEVSEEIIGPDMLGMQVSDRARLRPMLAVLILMMEAFGLAALISEEIERGTIRALLVTPLTARDIFLAKGILGTGMAFCQAIIFMAVVGGLSNHPVIVLTAMLLGAVLFTGAGFLMATLSKDIMSVMAWGVVVMIVMSVPAMGFLFPGSLSGWVEVIPTYYLVDTVHRVASFGAGWVDIWRNMLLLMAFNAAFVVVGVVALRRRFQ